MCLVAPPRKEAAQQQTSTNNFVGIVKDRFTGKIYFTLKIWEPIDASDWKALLIEKNRTGSNGETVSQCPRIDSIGSEVHVELLHVHFSTVERTCCCFVDVWKLIPVL